MINTILAHKQLIIIIASAMATMVSSLVNQLGPKTPKWLLTIADILAWIPKPGMKGVMGPVNLPGFPSKEVKNVQQN